MTDWFSLAGRVALVTGGAGDIGAATVRALAAAGASVLISDLDDQCETLATELRSKGVEAVGLVGDLSDMAAATRLGRRALGVYGRIDLLVCAAGIQGPAGPLGEVRPDLVERILAVNLTSVVALTGIVAPAMAQAGGGSIVLVSSIAGVRGNRAIGLYGLSKAALAQLARNLAVEWGPAGVRVNAISPGLIDTRFAQSIKSDAGYLERRLGLTPLRRMGRADEVAASILYLASSAAAFVTGHNLIVDGGTTISDGN